MNKNELIALANETRDKVEKLRAEMTVAVDSVSETEGDLYNLPFEEECGVHTAFCDLMDTLADFAHRIAEVKDLPEGTLVMCKAHESELDGWRVQYYWQKGVTLNSMGDTVEHSKWLYIVPLEYFKPTEPNWRPDEMYNWANFGKGEE